MSWTGIASTTCLASSSHCMGYPHEFGFYTVVLLAAGTVTDILTRYFYYDIVIIYYTPVGYVKGEGEKMINEAVKKESLMRLKKIEGQIRGVMRMVDEEKYCIDIIDQITAAEKALDGVARIIMKRHVESCVSSAIIKGRGQEKINELIDTVYKYSKGKRR